LWKETSTSSWAYSAGAIASAQIINSFLMAHPRLIIGKTGGKFNTFNTGGKADRKNQNGSGER